MHITVLSAYLMAWLWGCVYETVVTVHGGDYITSYSSKAGWPFPRVGTCWWTLAANDVTNAILFENHYTYKVDTSIEGVYYSVLLESCWISSALKKKNRTDFIVTPFFLFCFLIVALVSLWCYLGVHVQFRNTCQSQVDRSCVFRKSACDKAGGSGCQQTSPGTLCTRILMPTLWTPGTERRGRGRGLSRLFGRPKWQRT